MFQYNRRGILLATSFYKNFVIRKERQNGIDFEEVGIFQQQKGVLFQSFINFNYLVRPFIGRNSMKIEIIHCINSGVGMSAFNFYDLTIFIPDALSIPVRAATQRIA